MKQTRKRLIFFLIGILIGMGIYSAGEAAPGDWSLEIHVGSHHLDTSTYTTESGEEKQLREFNPGVGFIYEWTEYIEARGGLFINSFDKTSGYLGMGIHTSYDRLFSISLQAGILSGYQGTPINTDSRLLGYVIPVAGLNTPSKGVIPDRTEIGYIMGREQAGYKTNDVLTLGFVWKF